MHNSPKLFMLNKTGPFTLESLRKLMFLWYNLHLNLVFASIIKIENAELS